jgi:uncharacterized membrane protein
VSELLVITFRDKYRAAEVLNELLRREWDWVVDLEQAVVIRMDEQSRLRVLFSVDPTNYQGVAWARVWSSFLELVMPYRMADGLTAAAGELACELDSENEYYFDRKNSNADVAFWREKIRAPERFIRDVGALIGPGNSSLVFLLQTSESASVMNRLRDYSSMILHTPLSQEQNEQLMSLLAQRASS